MKDFFKKSIFFIAIVIFFETELIAEERSTKDRLLNEAIPVVIEAHFGLNSESLLPSDKGIWEAITGETLNLLVNRELAFNGSESHIFKTSSKLEDECSLSNNCRGGNTKYTVMVSESIGSEIPNVRAMISTLKQAKNIKAPSDEIMLRNSNTSIYKRSAPSVVKIINASNDTTSGDGYGSGSIISDDGFIITNWHVIQDYNELAIQFFSDSNTKNKANFYQAKVIKFDPRSDLALLKVLNSPRSLSVLPISTKNLEVGEEVHAIGHPLGLYDWTYTKGYISQVRNDYEWSIEQSSHYADVIQTATPISAGNSGGPLLSEDAKLIGVNTFGSTEGQNLNFAVSAKEVEDFLRKDQQSMILPLSSFAQQATYLGAADINEDGKEDAFYYDANSNGICDMVGLDQDGNGSIDFYILDINENEIYDGRIESYPLDGKDEIIWFVDDDEDGDWDRIGVDFNRDYYPDSLEKIEG